MKLSKLGAIKDAHCDFRLKTLYKFIANLHTEKIRLYTIKTVVDLEISWMLLTTTSWVGVFRISKIFLDSFQVWYSQWSTLAFVLERIWSNSASHVYSNLLVTCFFKYQKVAQSTQSMLSYLKTPYNPFENANTATKEEHITFIRNTEETFCLEIMFTHLVILVILWGDNK